MTQTTPSADIASLSFEDALKELEAIVKRLEDGQGSLDDSIRDYERGSLLKRHCEKRLDDARLKVEKLVGMEDGSLKPEPFDA